MYVAIMQDDTIQSQVASNNVVPVSFAEKEENFKQSTEERNHPLGKPLPIHTDTVCSIITADFQSAPSSGD